MPESKTAQIYRTGRAWIVTGTPKTTMSLQNTVM